MKKITFLLAVIVLLALFMPGLLQANGFKPAYEVNRAKACAHKFFSLFEKNPRNPEAVISMLAGKFDLDYPWGRYKKKEEVRKWIKSIPNEFQDAHHIRDISVKVLDDKRVQATAQVSWENKGRDNQHGSAELIYNFILIETGDVLPKIEQIDCQTLHKKQ